MNTINEGLYWVQVQAPAGNWTDRTGIYKKDPDALDRAKQSAKWERESGRWAAVRIVTKTINIIEA